MAKYFGKRLVIGLITLFALATITFFLMHAIPGSPFAGETSKLPANVKEKLVEQYGLDKPVTEQVSIPVIAKACGKPTIGADIFIVKFGLLCSVVKTGEEQGETSANMLLKAMNKTPVSQIPITRNHNGKRMINVTVLKELGITP